MANNYTTVAGSNGLAFYAYSRINQLNTFYVDANLGFDGATIPGSEISPFRSIAYAATRVTAAGMTIYAKAGIYNETLQIVLSRGVSLRGDGIGRTIINSTFATNATGSINMVSPAGNPVDGNQKIYGLTLNGVSRTGVVAIYSGFRNNIEIFDVHVIDFDRRGIQFFSDEAFPNPSVFDYATGNSVHDCIIQDSSISHGVDDSGGLRYVSQDGFLNYNNVFLSTGRAVGTNGNSITTNWTRNCKAFKNTFYRNNHELDNWNFFWEHWNYEGGCEVYDNVFYGLATLDFGGNDNERKDGYLYGMRCYNNKFFNNANGNRTNGGFNKLNQAITIEGQGHQYLQVFNNVIQRYGIGITIQTANLAIDYYLHHIRIYNNLITNVGFNDHASSYGIQILSETPNPGNSNTLEYIDIINNTIHANPTLATYRGIGVNGNGNGNYWNVSNNIVVNFDNNAIYFDDHAADGFNMTGLRAANNDMFNNGTNNASLNAVIVVVDCNVTTDNIVLDPQFIGGEDFHLQSITPCRIAGIPISYIFNDLDGIPIEIQPTIGCYQLN